MARGVALSGSLIVHGAVALAIAAVATRAVPRPIEAPPTEIAIEIVPPASAAPRANASSGSAPAPATATSANVTAPSSPAISRTPPIATRHARSASHAQSVSHAADITMRIEPTGGSGVDGIGDGHRGSGIGFGDGNGLTTPAVAGPPPPPAPEPPPPPPSNARAPRLIWPAREGEIEDSLLFVARLTIDTDGIVVGARLLQGVGGARDGQAENAVWRFRYRPALDDAGRPIQVTIEQPFLLE